MFYYFFVESPYLHTQLPYNVLIKRYKDNYNSSYENIPYIITTIVIHYLFIHQPS